MGHLNLVGFETGSHLDEVYSASGDVLTQSLTTRTGGFALKVSPVDSATANVSVSTISSAGEHVETLADTSYVRFYLRIETLPTATEEIFVIDGESIAKLSLRLTSTGHVSLYRGELIHVVTGSTALPVNQWVQMELFVETGVAAGYELRINEFSEFSGTMDSQESATLYYFGKLNDWNGSGYVVYFDDIAIRDDMWAGSGEIKVLTPNGTGTYDDWTPSTGLVSYPCVDEIPFNDDTDYISTVFVDDATTVSLQNTSTANVTGTVNGVKVVARVRDSGASPFGAGVLVRLKSGGTTVDTSSSTVYNSYVSRFYLSTLDPNTSANWTLSSLDSLEVGVVHRPPASLTGVRCTTVVAMVDYNPTTAFTASPLGSLKSSGAAVLTHTVQYDSNQRITISGSGNGQRTFFYDSVGNLSFKGLLWYENYHVPRIQLTVSGVFPVLVTANTWVHSPSGQLFNVGGSATLLSRQGLVYIGNGGKQQGLFLANDSVVQGFGYQTSNDNTSDFIAGQSSLPTPGQWYSVVLKRVNDTVYLFVNGTLITQSSNPSAVAEYGVNPQVWIGKWIYSYFNGKIDDVRIYSRGLTTTDIQSLASGDDLSNASFTYVPHFAHESRGRLFVKGVTAEHYYFSPSGTLQVSGRFGFSGDTISPLFAISDGTSSQALVLTRNYETSPTMVGLGFLSSNDDDTNYHDSVGTNPPVNQWMHLSMVRTATDIKLYVNGTLVSTTPVTKLATFGSNPKAILAHLFDNFFKGKLDDARFYLRALSANEVGSLSQGHELSTASFIYDVKHYHESEGRLRLRGVYPERNILFFDAVGTLRVTGYFTLDNGTVQYVPRGRIRFVGLGKVKIDTPQEAGGLLGVLDGLAEPNAVTVRYRASGRVRLSGISELMSGIHRHEGSGMLTLRGRSTFYTRPFIQSRGKLKFTGVAEVALLAPYEASGALGSYRIEELRGIRGIATVFFVPATVGFGKLTFNGYAEHFTLPFVKPNSGFRLRGTADVSVNPVREGHVKVVLSGISSCQSGFIFNSGGDLQLSGSCEDAYFTGPLFVPSGRLRFVGRAPFTLSGTIPVSSVTLTLSGGATTNHGPSSEPLGKVTLSGIAGYQVTATCEPTGRLTTSGVGVEVHHAASGKLVVSGETVVTFGVIQISAGKLTLSGVCTLNYGIRYEALGRLLFAGEAGQKAWTHVTSGRLVVSGTGETTSATVLPATGAIAVSGVSTTRTTAIVSPVGFLIVSGNTSLHYTVEPVGSIVIAGTSGAVVLSYVHVPTGKLTITGVCGLTGIAYVIVTASGSIRVSGNNQLGAHYSFLPAGVLATLGGISGSHESGAESSIPVLPEAGIPGVFQRGCLPWIDQESFFKMINPNHEIWGVLNQLTFSGWEFVCFNRKTREGTIKIGQRVYVITVTDLGSRTPVRESTPTVEQRSTDVNRSGAGFVDKVPVKTVCGSISNRDLLNLIPESSVKTYLEGLDMSEWRVVCFDRKTRRAELQIQNRRVAITVPDINIHVNDSQSTSSPQESDSQGFGMVGPVAVSAEQNKPVSAGKVDNSLKISQDKFIKIINNQEIRKVLLGLPKDQWQINKYDGKRRKAEIRIQNRYITVAV